MGSRRSCLRRLSRDRGAFRGTFFETKYSAPSRPVPLVLQRIKEDIPGSVPGEDYAVFSGNLRLGRIHKIALTSGVTRWHWNLFALHGPPDKITHDGYTDSLKQAKVEFAANVRAVLALARWREIDPPRKVVAR
jgi:hypothetical protein